MVFFALLAISAVIFIAIYHYSYDARKITRLAYDVGAVFATIYMMASGWLEIMMLIWP